MHSLIRFFLLGLFIIITFSHANSDILYSCDFNGKIATYHENEAKRMVLLGANCRNMNEIEHVVCAMNGVKVDYSRNEAEELLYRHPDAYCEMSQKLFTSTTQKSGGLSLVDKVIIYFPINSNYLSYKSLRKLSIFSQRHRNMGYTYTITGYASATGSASKNKLISLKRAGVVRNTLLNYGIHQDRILSVDALGEESLRYNTQYEFSLNRAVEIKVYQ